MHFSGVIVLELAAALITLGGLYDLFTPRLPRNLAAVCASNREACRLLRELLRALGGALTAIGVSVGVLASKTNPQSGPTALIVILVLVVFGEGINAICMYRVGSPFYVPVAFVVLAVTGVMLEWLWARL